MTKKAEVLRGKWRKTPCQGISAARTFGGERAEWNG